MSFRDLPLHLQHRIAWLFRQNLWTERQVPRDKSWIYTKTWYARTVSFKINATKTLAVTRRGDPRYTNVSSFVCTDVRVVEETGVALVCECRGGDQSVTVSLQSCHTKKLNGVEETENCLRSIVTFTEQIDVDDGLVEVRTATSQRYGTAMTGNPAHRFCSSGWNACSCC